MYKLGDIVQYVGDSTFFLVMERYGICYKIRYITGQWDGHSYYSTLNSVCYKKVGNVLNGGRYNGRKENNR